MRTADITHTLRSAGYGEELSNLNSAAFTAMDRYSKAGGLFVKKGPGLWALQAWGNNAESAGGDSDSSPEE